MAVRSLEILAAGRRQVGLELRWNIISASFSPGTGDFSRIRILCCSIRSEIDYDYDFYFTWSVDGKTKGRKTVRFTAEFLPIGEII